MWIFIIHFLFALFEQFDGLFAFPYHIQNEDVEMLIVVQFRKVIFILCVNESEPLISVWQYVEYEWWWILKVHLGMLTQFHNLVHQFPCLLKCPLIDGSFWWCNGFGERTVQFHQYRSQIPGLYHSVRARWHHDVQTHQWLRAQSNQAAGHS